MSSPRRSGLDENGSSLKKLQTLPQERSYTLGPPVFKISNVSSSSCCLQNKPECPDLPLLHISGQSELDSASVKCTSSTYDKDKPWSPSPDSQHFEDSTKELVKKVYPLQLKIPTRPSSLSAASSLVPTISPRLRSRSEASAESSELKSVPTLSPASPSRKYFRVTSSSLDLFGPRRGSEPVLDRLSRTNMQQLQLSVTDRRWEKLRSILMVMKEEPFDVEKSLSSSSAELLHSTEENASERTELFALQKQVLFLQDALKQKEHTLQQVEAERDSALAYIRHVKGNAADYENKSTKLYEQDIENLRAATVSKENIIDLLVPLMKELHEQKSYLDCLMTVVLMRAPWMLDEMDKTELPNDQQHNYCKDDDDDYDDDDDDLKEDCQYEDSDEEVWC